MCKWLQKIFGCKCSCKHCHCGEENKEEPTPSVEVPAEINSETTTNNKEIAPEASIDEPKENTDSL